MATILIAEDRDIDRHYLATLLGYCGHRVIQASDGAQALKETVQERPDLIISDVLMPTLDGYEFVRQLRAVPAVARTPVIFHTAIYHQREAMTLARQCGVNDILTKPSEPDAIIAKVDAVLGRPSVVMAVPPVDSFDREHLRVVGDALVEKVAELEASQLRLAAVVTLCHQFTSQLDPIALLQSVCAAARDVTLASHCVVRLVNDDRTAVRHAVTCGRASDDVCDADISRPAGPLPNQILNDRTAVRRTHPEPEVHSYLGVPIASSTRVYGWIELQNKVGAGEFNDRDEQVAIMIGIHAGIAYENARLVDDLQQQAAALRSIEERTNYALSAAKMGVWEIELATSRLTWSESMAPIFGLTPETAPATVDAVFALTHPEDLPMVEAAVARAARDGADFEAEHRVLWPDGSARWVAVKARTQRDADGTPLRLLGVASDVSDRKTLEAQFRQAQKMEAVGQLAGGVAHDFNNLLTVILGYSNLVIDRLEPEDTRLADLREVVTAAQRAESLTSQLLAFSRKQVLKPTTVDLNAIVSGMRQMLGRLIGEHVDLVPLLAPDLGAIRADRGQLEQVLMNLVINARDAMPSGGRVSVQTANVELDESYVMQHQAVLKGSYVMLAISDSGAGMTEETKRRLFEPFFTTKAVGKGTGLGLATVYGIVKQSGGYIWVYSELGHGATFKVYLPRVDRVAADDAPAITAAVNQAPAATTMETVMVVEDEDAVRFLTCRILEQAGYRVLDAQNPEQAETLFDEHPHLFALVVSDVVMPGLSGPNMFERLAQRSPQLKVLYVSGYTSDAIVHQGQLDSGIEFLQKPFTADALRRRVRSILDS